MKEITILLIFLSAVQTAAQSFEYFEDEGYRNEYSDVKNIGDTMWVVTGNYRDEFYTGGYITAFDTNGTQIWKYTAPTDVEVRRFDKVEQLPNGNLAVFGIEQFCCDCPTPFAQLQLFTPDGEWIGKYDFEGYTPIASDIAVSYSAVLLNGHHPSGPRLFAVDFNGDWLWSLDVDIDNLHHVIKRQSGFAAFFDLFAIQIDSIGNVTDTLQYETPPVDVVSSGEQILLLFEYGLYQLNEEMEAELIFTSEPSIEAKEVIPANEGYFLWNDSLLLKYDASHQLEDSVLCAVLPDFEIASVAVRPGHMTLVGSRRFDAVPLDYQIYRGATIQSISLYEAPDTIFPDLAMKNVAMNNMVVTTVDPDVSIYYVTGTVSGYVVNTGDVAIQSANINEMHSQGVCGLEIHRTTLDSLNLLPGDSVYIMQDFGPVYYYDFVDVMFGKACIFVSSPNNLHDRYVQNDIGCAPFDIVTAVEERKNSIVVFPNPARNRLTFQLPELSSITQIQIFNSTGTVVAEYQIADAGFFLDVSSWISGIYYARMIAEGAVSTVVRFSVAR